MIRPFLKAYNKRVDDPLDPDELVRVEIDGRVVDGGATCSSLLNNIESCRILLVPIPWSTTEELVQHSKPLESTDAAAAYMAASPTQSSNQTAKAPS